MNPQPPVMVICDISYHILEHCFQLFWGFGSNRSGYDFPVFEDEVGWNAEDVVLGGDAGVAVDVDFGNGEMVAVFVFEVSEDMFLLLAWRTPGAPELDHHGMVGVQEFL